MLIFAGSRYGRRLIVLSCFQHLLICISASYEGVCRRPITSPVWRTVFFNRFGDCEKTEPFELVDENYTLKHVGGDEVHENTQCSMTFKAPPDNGVCLKFDQLEITECDVLIKLFTASTSTGDVWKTFDCKSAKPGHMCTPSRYVTVQVKKEKLNYNRGYKFKIRVEKGNSITEEGVLFASIGVFVGVILGVVVLTSALAISIVYCCCKHKHGAKKKTCRAEGAAAHESRSLVQPSAPPPDIEDQHWVLHAQGHLYPVYSPYPNGQHPPPYVPPPPPYQPHEISQEPELADFQHRTCSVKPN